jgi:hypothetical protein
MRTFVRHAVVLLALAAMCQARIARAEDLHWISEGNPSASLIGDEKAAPAKDAAAATNGSICGSTACSNNACGCIDAGCDECPRAGIVGFAGLDSFKGISDAFLNSNFGVVGGVNSAIPLMESGISWQLGMSYGIYDVDGRVTLENAAQTQQQAFITTGFFHKAHDDQRLSYGIVYDWMLNNNWGILGTDPTMGQWRGQIEYALSSCNSVGVWGTARDLGARTYAEGGTLLVENRAMSQVNMFWHHKFATGADSWLFVGLPERDRLNGDGSLGDWTIGANVQVPLSESLALYANGSYFRPSQAAGVEAQVENGYDVGMGVVWYFGRHAVSHSLNGACGLPYMSVANNTSFLVDQRATLASPIVIPGVVTIPAGTGL